MSSIKTEIHDINETRKKVNVIVAASEVADLRKSLLGEFQRDAKIPGFRPGKAPENVVLARYGKELQAELTKHVVQRAYEEGVGKSDLEVFSIVESDNVKVAPDEDTTINFVVDVIPEFELPNYEGLKVKVESTKPTAEEVDAVVKQLLSQRAEFKTVEKTVEAGNYVKCSYEGKIGDELIADMLTDKPIWGTQKNTWEEAGTDHPYGVPAIVKGLVGMNAGDQKEVAMDFPEDFEIEVLAGKKGVYSLEVEEVREKILPEMDEAFFKRMPMKDEAEMRERISKSIEDQKKQQNQESVRQQVIHQLLESTEISIPESGIDSERNALLTDFMQKNMEQGGSEADFEAHKEDLYREADKAATESLKTRFILSKIAGKENIKVENDDFGRLIMNEAEQTGQKTEKIVKEIQKDQGRLNRMRIDILLEKTLSLILEKTEPEAGAKASESTEASKD